MPREGTIRDHVAALVTAGLFLVFLPPTAGAQRLVSPDSARTESGSAPVVVWNREITWFRAPVEGVPPAERAREAERRLLAIPTGLTSYHVESKPIAIGSDSGAVITVNGALAFGLLARDADLAGGETLDQASGRAMENLRTWLADRSDQLRWPSFFRALGWSLAATLLALLLLNALLWLHRRVVVWLERSTVVSKRDMPHRLAADGARRFVTQGAAHIDGDPNAALRSLAEHATRFPTGSMQEERESLRAIALCDSGRVDEGAALVRRQTAGGARAPYASRMRAACSIE